MSTTYISAIVAFLTLALPVLGVHVVRTDTLTEAVTQTVGVLSILYVFYGRYMAGGINAWGLRK